MKKAIFLIVAVFINVCMLNAQSTWTQKADFAGSTRLYAVGFCIGTKCYMGTGSLGTGSTQGGPILFKDFWEWDSASNIWTQKADFGGGFRYGAVAFTIGNKGYIATGTDNTKAYNDLWEYDPANNSWTQKSSLPAIERGDAVAFTIGSKAYIGTGHPYQPSVLQDLWEWDQPTDTWTQKTNYLGGPRMNAIAFSIGNKGYIGTGADDNNVQKDFWEWDQATDVWIRKADFPFTACFLSSFSIGNNGYAGINCNNDTSKAGKLWQWDPFTNIWTLNTNFPGTSCGYIGFSNKIKGYIGGEGSKEFWEFDPVGTTSIKEELNFSSLQVFPNPAGNVFTIKYVGNVSGKIFLSVKNAMGQVVYTGSDAHFSGAYNKVIDLGTNAKGIYFVEVTCGPEHQIRKIVLE